MLSAIAPLSGRFPRRRPPLLEPQAIVLVRALVSWQKDGDSKPARAWRPRGSTRESCMNAVQKYDLRASRVRSLLCVGLDSTPERMPARFRSERLPQYTFNQYVIEQTHRYVSAYKPNSAFYEARGAEGIAELELTLRYLREQHPDILLICDAKRGDNA